MEKCMKRLLPGITSVWLVFFLFQCTTVETKPPKQSPPPWAPAHGVRSKYTYHYYPSTQVYFDLARKQYFFIDQGIWRMTTSLPRGISLAATEYVVLEMDTDKPYTYFEMHKKKYPGKKKKPKKWKK